MNTSGCLGDAVGREGGDRFQVGGDRSDHGREGDLELAEARNGVRHGDHPSVGVRGTRLPRVVVEGGRGEYVWGNDFGQSRCQRLVGYAGDHNPESAGSLRCSGVFELELDPIGQHVGEARGGHQGEGLRRNGVYRVSAIDTAVSDCSAAIGEEPDLGAGQASPIADLGVKFVGHGYDGRSCGKPKNVRFAGDNLRERIAIK